MKETEILTIEELNPYVRKAGRQNCNSWKNRERKIYDHEFLYCCAGKAYIRIGDTEYAILPGTLVLIKPDRSHSFWMDEAQPAEMYWVHFDFVFRKDVVDLNELVQTQNGILFNKRLPLRRYIRTEPLLENGLQLPEILEIQSKSIMEGIFKKILYHYEKSSPFRAMECKILLLQLLETVLKQLQLNISTVPVKEKAEVISIVQNFVIKNHYRKISLKDAADMAGYSKDYLGKLYKQVTGECLVDFIHKVRLQYAAGLMLETDLSLTDIAEMVGFNDLFYFSRVVKKYEGVAPSEWRKILKASK